MTNEKIVWKIRQGSGEYIPVLWDNIAPFVEWKASRYLSEYPQHYQNLKEDLVQEGYFAMLEAVKSYDDEKGAFTTYLSYYLKNSFKAVIFSGRGQRKEKDPLNNTMSIDSPIDDAEGLTLADMIIDETAEGYYRRMEDIDFWESVNSFLSEAINHIKNKKGREVIRYMLKTGGTIKEAQEALYPGKVQLYEQYRSGITELKRYMRRSIAKKEMRLIGLDDYVYGWGLKSWKNHLFTSSVEVEVVRRIELDNFYKDIYTMV